MTRGSIIAAVVVCQLAVLGEAVVAVRGDHPRTLGFANEARAATGSRLVEDGMHRVFDPGDQPTVSIDIGYADLSISTHDSPKIDASLAGSSDFGLFRAQAPITAVEDGRTIRVATAGGHGWSSGDDRRVTLVVPRDTKIAVISAGDISVEGLRAEASITSVGRGSILVEDFEGPALHVASDGPITLNRVAADRLEATSSDDRIDGAALAVRDGSVDADDRVSLGFAAGTDTVVSADAEDGSVSTAGVAGDASASGKSSTRVVRLGNGNGTLNVHSSDGNISLSQEG